jgi:hypothetical protein
MKAGGKAFLVILSVTAAVIALVVAVLIYRHFADPYRTLESFPIAQYLENPQPLSGLKFKAQLRADADLGWKDGVGRLMAFTVEGSPSPVAIFIPPTLSNIYFTKGQNYRAEIEIKDGGLIHAISCEKN